MDFIVHCSLQSSYKYIMTNGRKNVRSSRFKFVIAAIYSSADNTYDISAYNIVILGIAGPFEQILSGSGLTKWQYDNVHNIILYYNGLIYNQLLFRV